MPGPQLDPLSHEGLAALATPAPYVEDPSASPAIEWKQTHLSHVFLTGERVYKLRKPVDLGFVRFAERAQRNADCLEEIRLNRRLAPDVYLGVAPLWTREGRLRVGPVAAGLAGAQSTGGEVPEHCVVMRRLPEGRDALSLLEAGSLRPCQLERVAKRIARFHGSHPLERSFEPDRWLSHCLAPIEANFTSLAQAGPELVRAEQLAFLREAALAFARDHGDRLVRRWNAGRCVDGHGDLHLQHVWFEADDAEPLVIDCVEFEASFRALDAASEVAFLAMDLEYREAPGLAAHFLRSYARETDDFDLYGVVDFFLAYRAGVRAKVAAIAAREPEIAAPQRAAAAESVRRHLALAERAVAAHRPGVLLLVGGVVGTGKSTAAARLADATEGVIVSSDRLRKRLLGVRPTDRPAAGWHSGAYAPEITERVYAGLLERSAPIVASGRTAVLDATFSRRRHRDAARAWAERCGARVHFVEVRCAPQVALRRLKERAARGLDPSDAGPELYAASAAAFEPVEEWPASQRSAVETDAPGSGAELERIGSRLG